MGIALNKLAAEDPSFRVKTDEESGQTIIAGMGELHLDILVDRMKREFKVEANIGAPQVAYRETITKTADVDYTTRSSPVVLVSSLASSSLLSLPSRMKALSSRARSLAVTFLRNTFLVFPKVLKASCRLSIGRLPDARHQGNADGWCLPRC